MSPLLLSLSVVDVLRPGGGSLSGGFRALIAAAARGDPWSKGQKYTNFKDLFGSIFRYILIFYRTIMIQFWKIKKKL